MNRKIGRFLSRNNYARTFFRSIFRDSERGHWCRVVMNKSTVELVKRLDYQNLSVLEISGRKWKDFGFKEYRNVYFPEFDVSRDSLEQQFDLIIAEQVFEHVQKPCRAGRNVYSMLRSGGHFLITTPFLLRIHSHPDDCNRWSRSGIRFFLEECGFDLTRIESYSWGNRQCVKANLNFWMPYVPYWHSLKNEDNYPVVVWALARK